MAQRKLHFTKNTLEAIAPPGRGRDTYSDDITPGLKLRVTPNGVKTFTLVKKALGQTHFVTLGTFPVLSVAMARRRAIEEAAQLTSGKRQRRQRPVVRTFGELFIRYMEGHAKPHKRTWQEDQRKYEKLLSRWAATPIEKITREEVTRLHTKLGQDNGHYMANRTLALLKVVFNYGGQTLGLRIENPCNGIKKFRELQRDRFLNRDELKQFLFALHSDKTSADWADFFSLALWTGARRANVQAMRWENIDLKAGLWQIPGGEFKNGEPFKVVLTVPALEILARRKLDSTGSPFVFPANSESGHVVEPRKAWQNLLKEAGLTGLTIHDLRRTLGSWQAATGASLQVIGKALGHKDTATTAIYARLDLDPVRIAMNTATTAMLEAANGMEKKE